MKSARAFTIALSGLSLLALAACNRSDPPSDQLEAAAEDMVEAVESTPAALADIPQGPYAPRDDCTDVKGTGSFLAALYAAVAAHDTDALLELAAEDVKLDFGGGAGRDELRALLEAEDGAMWAELNELLELGCASDGEALMTLPWYFAQEIPADPFESYIVTGEDVVLAAAPADNAADLARISWDVVEMAYEDEQVPGFTRVAWRDRSKAAAVNNRVEGYIATDHLRSLIDYRLIASSRNGRWRITSLIAGD